MLNVLHCANILKKSQIRKLLWICDNSQLEHVAIWRPEIGAKEDEHNNHLFPCFFLKPI